MFNKREFKIGIVLLGSIILLSSIIFQGLFNIFDTCFWLVIAVIVSFIGVIYIYLAKYKNKNQQALIQKNKVLLLWMFMLRKRFNRWNNYS